MALRWGLLNVSDPSSHAVLDDAPETKEIEHTKTRGIGLLAWATRAPGFQADSLGPTRPGARPASPEACHALGAPGTTQSMTGTGISVVSPDHVSYLWNGWERPITQARVKKSAEAVRQLFEGMESRESASQATRETRH